MHLIPLSRRELMAAFGALSLSPFAQAADPPLDDALKALVDDAQFPLAGLSVLVTRGGRVVHEAQFGMRHFGPDLPVTRDTLFRVASISKLVTGLGALRLAEMGKLDLEADVGELLGKPVRNPAFPHEPVRVRSLMTHQSSLRDEGGIAFDAPVMLVDELARNGKCWDAEHAPGWFAYCNLNYGLLATVMEKVSGQRFDLLMNDLVLKPLGLAGGFDAMALSDAERANTATLYRKQQIVDGKEVWNAAGPWVAQTDDWLAQPPQVKPGLEAYVPGTNGTLFSPQGGLRTRVADLGRVMAMLLAGGVLEGKRFLQPKSVEALTTERWRHELAAANGDNFGGEFQAWGLGAQHFIDRSGPGWGDRLRPQGGLFAWGHLGFAYGLQAALMFDPARQAGIVYVINGHSAEPLKHRGRFSSFDVWEEKLHTTLWHAAGA
jgi:CubicO group peptidase (beta-lactamase class C family)